MAPARERGPENAGAAPALPQPRRHATTQTSSRVGKRRSAAPAEQHFGDREVFGPGDLEVVDAAA
ncbi:MAG TPA: hypothetical protein VLU41_07935, partial [Ideonella sp.]|nr:hypothetical protein [Ideonella sp.]